MRTIEVLCVLILILLPLVFFVFLHPGIPQQLQTIISGAFSGANGALFLTLRSCPTCQNQQSKDTCNEQT